MEEECWIENLELNINTYSHFAECKQMINIKQN